MTSPSRALLPSARAFGALCLAMPIGTVAGACEPHIDDAGVDRPCQILTSRDPDDEASYIEELHGRSAIRSDRLVAQREEAVLALNNAAIIPALVKRAATLATCSQADRASRLMLDLDIVVRGDETDAAKKALAGISYAIDYEADRRETK